MIKSFLMVVLVLFFSFPVLAEYDNIESKSECDEILELLGLCDIEERDTSIMYEPFTDDIISNIRGDIESYNLTNTEKSALIRKLIVLSVELMSPENGKLNSYLIRYSPYQNNTFSAGIHIKDASGNNYQLDLNKFNLDNTNPTVGMRSRLK